MKRMKSRYACSSLFVWMFFFIQIPLKGNAHPLDLALLVLQEHDSNKFTLSFQLTTVTVMMPLAALVNVPESCKIEATVIDVERVSQYRYRQNLLCDTSGFLNKRFTFELSEGTNIMVRLLRGKTLVYETLLEQGVTTWEYQHSNQSNIQILNRYITLGIQHILVGLDHLIFLSLLLLIATWGKKLIVLITAFTIGHSFTLALATLEIIRLPAQPVEAAIALSILFLASEIIKKRETKHQTLTLRYPGIVTALFGSLHGLGFASVLSEVGVSKEQLLWNLLGFNIGVEVGQIIFILFVMAIYKLVLRAIPTITIGKTPIAYIGGSVGAFWLVERLASF